MPRVQPVELKSRDLPQWMQRMAAVVNGILLGRLNNVHDVTLAASVTTTLVSDARFTLDTVLLLMPLTANAAAALGGLYQVASTGAVTLHHASLASTDRTFRYAIVG